MSLEVNPKPSQEGCVPIIEALILAKAWARSIWVVVKIRVPFWVPRIIRHQLFRYPKKGP